MRTASTPSGADVVMTVLPVTDASFEVEMPAVAVMVTGPVGGVGVIEAGVDLGIFNTGVGLGEVELILALAEAAAAAAWRACLEAAMAADALPFIGAFRRAGETLAPCGRVEFTDAVPLDSPAMLVGATGVVAVVLAVALAVALAMILVARDSVSLDLGKAGRPA
jgi:hypothetical protein